MQPIIKEWKGDQMAALSLYQADANLMAEQGYFPVDQEWLPDSRVFMGILGVALIPLGIGIVILLRLMFTQNSKGRWTVKYAYREKPQPPAELAPAPLKTCPRCAEQVKDAAAICRYCNYEFPADPHAADLCESVK